MQKSDDLRSAGSSSSGTIASVEVNAVPIPLPPSLTANPALTAQRVLLERIVSELAADERCLAVWLGGSFARGEGDVLSDVDVGVAVDDANVASFLVDLEANVDRIVPTIFKRLSRLGDSSVLTAVTRDWQRFDVSTHPLSTVSRPIAYPRLVLFDRSEVQSRFGPLQPTPSVPADRLAWLVEEFWRVLGLLVVVAGREEYLVGVDGVTLLRRYLIDLMLLENGSKRGGALHLNAFLTTEQRRTLESLPALLPTREAVVEGNLACALAFRPLARQLMARYALNYPEGFEQATLAHLARNLSVHLE